MKIRVWYMGWGTIAIIILQLMTDALMIQVYRCRTIWHSCRHHTHHGVVAGYPHLRSPGRMGHQFTRVRLPRRCRRPI
ncbi:hypothetical protein V8E55_009624 [Tylopilus felleus]